MGCLDDEFAGIDYDPVNLNLCENEYEMDDEMVLECDAPG